VDSSSAKRAKKGSEDAIEPILRALQAESVELRELDWRVLEEVVAELLAARGLQVDVTTRSRDGGRDIVARGDLVPGEPMRIAVEVKQKPVVDLGMYSRHSGLTRISRW
jgi:HJR/Mrr/RecB family endonuclease